jgi:predicted nucleic acid-binding protein
LISDKDLDRAIKIANDIDENDVLFVALTNHLNAKLWTGDKKLISGLKGKGYTNAISTNELYNMFLKKESRTRRK